MKSRAIKWYQQLHKAKGRKKESHCLIEGLRVLSQLLESGSVQFDEILVTEKFCDYDSGTIALRVITEEQMRSICDSVTPVGIVGVMIIPSFYRENHLPAIVGAKILFLEDVQDPGNLGTLLRSAVAFGFSGVILTEGCADLYAPKVLRSCGGVLGSLWVGRPQDSYGWLDTLVAQEYALVVADLDGEAFLKKADKMILALGNEGNGVSKRLHDKATALYTIPFNAEVVESLNVAVAGSISMFQMQ